jgi:hypothetical protein
VRPFRLRHSGGVPPLSDVLDISALGQDQRHSLLHRQARPLVRVENSVRLKGIDGSLPENPLFFSNKRLSDVNDVIIVTLANEHRKQVQSQAKHLRHYRMNHQTKYP